MDDDEVKMPRMRSGEGVSLLSYIKDLHDQNQRMIEKLEDHLTELEKRVRGVERVIWGLGGAYVLAQVLIHLVK